MCILLKLDMLSPVLFYKLTGLLYVSYNWVRAFVLKGEHWLQSWLCRITSVVKCLWPWNHTFKQLPCLPLLLWLLQKKKWSAEVWSFCFTQRTLQGSSEQNERARITILPSLASLITIKKVMILSFVLCYAPGKYSKKIPAVPILLPWNMRQIRFRSTFYTLSLTREGRGAAVADRCTGWQTELWELVLRSSTSSSSTCGMIMTYTQTLF